MVEQIKHSYLRLDWFICGTCLIHTIWGVNARSNHKFVLVTWLSHCVTCLMYSTWAEDGRTNDTFMCHTHTHTHTHAHTYTHTHTCIRHELRMVAQMTHSCVMSQFVTQRTHSLSFIFVTWLSDMPHMTRPYDRTSHTFVCHFNVTQDTFMCHVTICDMTQWYASHDSSAWNEVWMVARTRCLVRHAQHNVHAREIFVHIYVYMYVHICIYMHRNFSRARYSLACDTRDAIFLRATHGTWMELWVNTIQMWYSKSILPSRSFISVDFSRFPTHILKSCCLYIWKCTRQLNEEEVARHRRWATRRHTG